MRGAAPEVQGDLGWSLGVLLRGYRAAVTSALGDLPQGNRGYQVLATVVHGDQPSQLALAAHLGIDRTVMTYLIDDLAASGLVERRANPSDRRQRRVVATEAGVEALRRLEADVREAEDRLLAGLTPDDRDAFRRLLALVARELHGNDLAHPCLVVGEVLGDGSGDGGGPPRDGRRGVPGS